MDKQFTLVIDTREQKPYEFSNSVIKTLVTGINSLLAWSVKYYVNVFFADNRLLASAVTYRLLEKYHKYASGK